MSMSGITKVTPELEAEILELDATGDAGAKLLFLRSQVLENALGYVFTLSFAVK